MDFEAEPDGQPRQMTDVVPTIVGGFTNGGRCQAAASEIAGRLIVLGNNSRAEAGYQKTPAVPAHHK